MPPSASGNAGGRRSRPIPKAPDAGIRDAATPQIADLRRVPQACANIACRFSIGAWRERRPNPSVHRAASHLRPDRCARVVRACAYRPLAMTGRAAGELGRCPNLVLFPQLGADFRLIIRGLPVHIENLIFRAENLLGMAMA